MWLLIDDMRNLGCDIIARNAEAAKAVLGTMACSLDGVCLDGVCLDHDLGTGETGYDVLVWALQRKVLPNKVELVTSNPPGRERMKQALIEAGYVLNTECGYYERNTICTP